ncbi:MAG: type VI secretion system lipoprotein TssJ [Desulfobacterales bacterium]|nr:type VI secretion system lipoprotein TssJ [Desulfobacterales bacterium]
MKTGIRSFYRITLLFMVFSLVISCAAQPLPPPEWTFEKGAVTLHVKADSQLNFYDERPHPLHVCVYQLKDPNAFNHFSDTSQRLTTLIKECDLFDPSVVSSKKLLIQPNRDALHTMDRAEGAKYFSIAAGYHKLIKNRCVRLMDIPVHTEEKGFLSRTKTQKPGPLNVELILGPKQIE